MAEYMTVKTFRRCEMLDITARLGEFLSSLARGDGWTEGFLAVYSPHTTCGLTINEGYDPDVQRDLTTFLEHLVPEDWGFRHAEGNSDAHIKTSFFGSSVLVPVSKGRLDLGQWQAVYLCESDGPRTRRLRISFIREA